MSIKYRYFKMNERDSRHYHREWLDCAGRERQKLIDDFLSNHRAKEGANKRGNSSRLTQSFHFFMFEPIFSPVNALNQPI